MKNTYLLLIVLLTLSVQSFADGLWSAAAKNELPGNLQRIHPLRFLSYRLDEASLKATLFNLSDDPAAGVVIALPLPDGSFRSFRVWQKSMMPADLAAKYPQIRTFTAEALHNRTITAKLDFTEYGFHAMIFDGENSSFIDPYDLYHDGLYMVHYNKDETKPVNERMQCLTKASGEAQQAEIPNMFAGKSTGRGTPVTGGYKVRTYRLALSADSWYCQAATAVSSPSIAQCLSALTTSMNRINGVFEREFSVTMVFVNKEDTLIWPTATGSVNGTDPFYSINSNGGSCITQNQKVCDTLIGNSNYDIGHVFTTAAGGVTIDVGVVCSPLLKAQSATGQSAPVGDGFDINYVAHEMGHEFGGDHTFNDNMSGSCLGNAVSTLAYEPGSGTTIMAYAGICAPDDLQPNSDAYFHTINLIQMGNFITGGGDVCPVRTPSLNLPVGVDSFAANYTIPYLTPFELTAPIAHDSTSDTLTTYCWDQWNLGSYGLTFVHMHQYGPIFRSFSPVSHPSWRTFPRMHHVINGIWDDGGYENNQGEKVPDSARYLTFRLAMRDIYAGNGCFLIPADTVHLDVINTGSGFTVSSQASPGTIYDGGTAQTITWNNAGTPAAPFNTPDVDIYMSIDGGNYWTYHIGTFANNGSATITVPNPPVSVPNARFKVKGHGNVFFNINTVDFTVNYNSAVAVSEGVGGPVAESNGLVVSPIPAHDRLHVETGNTKGTRLRLCNSVGQCVWHGECQGDTDINVANLPAGVYYLGATPISGCGPSETKKIVVY